MSTILIILLMSGLLVVFERVSGHAIDGVSFLAGCVVMRVIATHDTWRAK